MPTVIPGKTPPAGRNLLGSIPLFENLSAGERLELELLLVARHFAAGQPIVMLGEPGDSFYIVQSGKLSVSCPDEGGHEVVLGTLGPGQFFGEISLLDGGPRTATVRALTAADLLALDRDGFLAFLMHHPRAAIHMLTILGQRQRETVQKVRGIRNVNEAVAQNLSSWHRLAKKVATVSASRTFVTLNIAFFCLWIIVNVLLTHLHPANLQPFDQAPTFSVLSFLVTVEALFITLFVLINQGQQSERDRIRADLDYQVNVKAHAQVMALNQKLDRLQAALGSAPGQQWSSEEQAT